MTPLDNVAQLRYIIGMEFDWDTANIEHIARHGVEPEEAEEAVSDSRRVKAPAYHAENGERRQAVTGKTEDGRLLTVVMTVRNEFYRVITAREANATERRAYRR